MPKAEEITLPEAGRLLGRTWMQTYNLLLRGEIDGRQVRGRWRLDRASVERLRQAQSAASDAGPKAAA